MQEDVKTISIDDLPALGALVREVNASRTPIRIVENGEELAVLRPSPRRRRTAAQEGPAGLTRDDSLWSIVGIAASPPGGPTDVASNKHKYLAEAYDTGNDDR